MGFLPFVNQGGQRVVRWHRLLLAWIAVFSACTFGSCATGYVLTGDWGHGLSLGVAVGVVFSAVFTVQGFITPVEPPPDSGPTRGP